VEILSDGRAARARGRRLHPARRAGADRAWCSRRGGRGPSCAQRSPRAPRPRRGLEFALSLLSRWSRPPAARAPASTCRGNWSRDERTLLSGGYAPLSAWFERAPVRQLVLEYATPRAGRDRFARREGVGLGVVNPRSEASRPGCDPAACRGGVAVRSCRPDLPQSGLQVRHLRRWPMSAPRSRSSGCPRSWWQLAGCVITQRSRS
jgi:hypothetical protein